MGFLGLGLPKGHQYKHKIGDEVRYAGKDENTKKMYSEKKLTVREREHKGGKDYYLCSVGGSKRGTVRFSEAIIKAKKAGLGSTAVVVTPVASPAPVAGLGKLKPFTKIQDVDKLAKSIQKKSGVKETVTVAYYNISRSQAKAMAWKQLSDKKK